MKPTPIKQWYSTKRPGTCPVCKAHRILYYWQRIRWVCRACLREAEARPGGSDPSAGLLKSEKAKG